ncbi:hypothetical protein [Bradyrhizobium sp. WSM471]|uniref:hypothetical protein n=1 Tax=Bradyrhizobium sp. WSM471 TaxID=319017 RepID=UPI0012F9A25C|nr:MULTISPECIES: hypothetical protein [Bradyrhizobium]UFW43466.1 hypothetical protein BcanWSM471_10480 [Bradyrhizobium canariense]
MSRAGNFCQGHVLGQILKSQVDQRCLDARRTKDSIVGPLIKCHDIDSDAESWMTILAPIVNIALARFHLHGQQGTALVTRQLKKPLLQGDRLLSKVSYGPEAFSAKVMVHNHQPS